MFSVFYFFDFLLLFCRHFNMFIYSMRFRALIHKYTISIIYLSSNAYFSLLSSSSSSIFSTCKCHINCRLKDIDFHFVLFFYFQFFFLLTQIETHYEEEVNRCLQMPAEYNTVVVRAKVAQKMYESATKEIKICEKLVFEQHLQQQGWAAVMANLEDLTNEFKQRRTDFLNTINDYVEQRPNYLSYLESFQDDLTKLSTVPILNEILPSAHDDFHGFDEYFQDNVSLAGSAGARSAGSNRGATSSSSTTTTAGTNTQSDESSHSETGAAAQNAQQIGVEQQPTSDADAQPELESSDQKQQQRNLTLLQWISTKENHRSLTDMAEDCARVLKHFDDTAIKNIKGTIDQVLKNAEKVKYDVNVTCSRFN